MLGIARRVLKSSIYTPLGGLKSGKSRLCGSRSSPFPWLGLRFASQSIHERYFEKLQARADKEGITVAELLEKAKPAAKEAQKSDAEKLKKQASQFAKPKEGTSSSGPESAETGSAEKVRAATASSTKPLTMELDSFIDVEKLAPHTAAEIEMLWKARFVGTPNAFSGSMELEAFSKLYVNARKYPTFVLPLPHKAHGVELHYVQWSFITSQTVYCLITSLAQYKLHTEYSHPHTTFMLHTDLASDKQLVLTNTVVQDNEVAPENAALLVLNLQRFYTAESGEKANLLREFNTGDTSFTAERLIAAADTLD